jgi:hypothetical protein
MQVIVNEDGDQTGRNAGLVIVPVIGETNKWRRVGFFHGAWCYDDGAECVTQDYFIGKEKEDIILV